MMGVCEKLSARRGVVAKTYTSLIRHMANIGQIPDDTSTDISQLFHLEQSTYEIVGVNPTITALQGEHKALSMAIELIEAGQA